MRRTATGRAVRPPGSATARGERVGNTSATAGIAGGAGNLETLQRLAGNRATARLLEPRAPVASPTAEAGSKVIQRTCERGHKDHADGPCPDTAMLGAMAEASADTRYYQAAWLHNLGPSDGGPGILAGGLDPAKGGTGASTADDKLKERSKGKVHVAGSRYLADDYKNLLEGKPTTEFGDDLKLEPEKQAPAEVLKLSLRKSTVDTLMSDPDDPRALVTDQAIPGKFVRRTTPAIVPQLGPDGDQLDWEDHQRRGDAELEALRSHFPDEIEDRLEGLEEEDAMTLLSTLRNALRTMTYNQAKKEFGLSSYRDPKHRDKPVID